MPEFLPFRGFRFSPELQGRLANILSPPFDKISPDQHRDLWDLDPLNAARLVLPPPEIATGDFATQSAASCHTDWYREARRTLDHWIREGILVPDKPSLYFYRQDFLLDSRPLHRWGVIGALGLENQDAVLPHEETFEGPKADRLRLMQATQANLCSIFLVATDPENVILATAGNLEKPDLDCTTPDGTRHRLCVVTDREVMRSVGAAVQASTLMIADGHHRYETARNYRALVQAEMGPSFQSPADRVMAYISPISQEGLVILPTHRVIRGLVSDWLARLEASSCVRVQILEGGLTELLRELDRTPQNEIALGASDGRRFALLYRKESHDPSGYAGEHSALQALDVIYLHEVILKHILRVRETTNGDILYLADPQQAIAIVRGSGDSVAFFLRPPDPARVMEVSRLRRLMPHKSTDFFPKVPTGLIIRLLREAPIG